MSEKRSARDAALWYLQSRDRTAGEIRRYLREKEYTDEEIEETLAFLREYRYVDDASYAARYLRYAVERGKGPLKVRADLEGRGVAAALIREALEEGYPEELEQETALREGQKAMAGKPAEQRFLDKTARRLQSRGFRASVITEVISRLRAAGSEDTEEN